MTPGRDPRNRYASAAGRSRTGGVFRGPNLPYTLVIVIALAVLIPFLLVAQPFAVSEDTATAVTTTTAAAATGDVAHGEEIFNATCIVCHGPGGIGIAGLGKPLTTSTFAAGLTDAELLAFLDVGRSSDDPLNTTGIAMPPRGGNTALTDADLMDVIAFVRTIGG